MKLRLGAGPARIELGIAVAFAALGVLLGGRERGWPPVLALAASGGVLCAMFFALAVRLESSVRAALLATVMLGVGTGVWVSARSASAEVVQTMCVFGLFSELVRVAHLGERGRGRRLALAAWAAALVVTGFALGWGPPLTVMNEHPLIGIWGLLFSFGKSVFLYSPPLVLAAFAARRFWREQPRIAGCVAVVVVPLLLVYARSLSWSGDIAWGPRHLALAIAPVMLAVPGWIDRMAARPWLRRVVLTSVFGAGVFVQLLGSAFAPEHGVRIAMAARQQWLGRPDRAGSMVVAQAAEGCVACFEDAHGHLWLPPFSPLLEHWWLLKHVPFEDSWETARGDSPWARHTRLDLDRAKVAYHQVRVDLWLLDDDHARGKRAMLAIAAALALLAGAALIHSGRRASSA